MQSLDVISINLWQILISLVNLLLLCLILKRFLFKPVKNMLKERKEDLEERYKNADDAVYRAKSNEEYWKGKREDAKIEAQRIIETATIDAKKQSENIINEAKSSAEGIIIRGKEEIEVERKKAEASIKREIADVSALIAEKLLYREINIKDHRELIDSAIGNMVE